MINNYFKIAFRALWRNKSFSLLNIFGLALGIAASLVIFIVVYNETHYNDYYKDANHIYRIVSTTLDKTSKEAEYSSAVPFPLPSAIRADFPGIETTGALWDIGSAQMYVPGDNGDEKKFKQEDLFFAEPEVFKIFAYTWLTGNEQSLYDVNTAAISESLAKTYFGNWQKAVGKTIQLWSYRIPLRITAVFKDQPNNTDVPIKLAGSYATFVKLNGNSLSDKAAWNSVNNRFQCFVKLPAGKDPVIYTSQLKTFVEKYYVQNIPELLSVPVLSFQPLAEMHLDHRYPNFTKPGLNKKELLSFSLIGLFLLLVACINFVNLATAQSVSRAKEIGVRKVLGSNRMQLLRQFLNETAFITLLAMLLALLLAHLSLPYISTLIGKTISFTIVPYYITGVFLLSTGIIVTLVAGFYPAIVLSGFNPLMAIKSKINHRSIGGISLRRGLVVFQFVVAQLLVIATLVVLEQMRYFRNQPMGFDRKAVVLVDLPSDSSLKVKYPYLKTKIREISGVTDVSFCMDGPSSNWSWGREFYFDGSPEKQPFIVNMQLGDSSYYKTFGIKLLAGRLPEESDTARDAVVNETLIKKLGLSSPGAIIGKTVQFNNGPKLPVVGVIRDFNSKSLREAVQPLVISSDFGAYNFMAVRFDPSKIKTALANVEKTFAGIYPSYLYDPTFMDVRVGNYYKSEQIIGQLFRLLAVLTILISCLGLYGLVSFMAVQKTKEVGIRKVLGASVQNIVYLFSREFTFLIAIAFLIAAPLGYYFMQNWLTDFHNHISIGWQVFLAALSLSVIIAWGTVGYKALRAALANPVKSLRME